MKKPSILTTLFPQIGFHHFTLKEILANGQEGTHSFRGVVEPDGSTALFDDFLPKVHYKGKVFSTDLEYRDAIDEDSQKILEAAHGEGRAGRGCVVLGITDYTSEVLNWMDPPDLRAIIDNGEPGDYRFSLIIILDKSLSEIESLPNTPEGNFEKANRLADRKVLFAKELTTIYRRYVELWLYLLKREDVYPIAGGDGKARPEKVSFAGTHPSDECAWRLACGFDSVWRVLTMFSKQAEFRGLPDLTAFLGFKEEHPGSYRQYLNHWLTEERIPIKIAEKKTVEYFIYKVI